MLLPIVVIFIIGYLLIALEHQIRIDKAAIALLLGMVLWTLYAIGSAYIVPLHDAAELQHYLSSSTTLQSLPLAQQCINFIVNVKVIEHLGDISEILFFLIGAMTIVELVDIHGGFSIVTNRITTRKKQKLLWLLAFLTFIMSAILDNLTTTIVMVMLLKKLLSDQKERWLFGSVIVIAANSGGAWSPIGDITTIMLWVKGNVTTPGLIKYLLLPSLASMIVPLLIIARKIKGETTPPQSNTATSSILMAFSSREKAWILVLGILALIFVPVFKGLTSLPPFIGVLLSLSLLWVFIDCLYNKKNITPSEQYRVPNVLKRIDTPTILFFLGILMAVAVLQSTGILTAVAVWLDKTINNIYIINILLGLLSAIVDNVPLVAAAIGMYPLADPALISGPEAAHMMQFVQDGTFWQFLSYCVGVGGSTLIIGSAAGVVVMGIEKINFMWYLRNISLIALIGYLCGAL
ncbi:MAG: sodium:proton antiporter NhaD, partial [Coprobacter sp.]|nr:sodium:proton antiporter NhaD [Coprobacter sp.]